MSNPDHVKLLKRGREAVEQFQRDNPAPLGERLDLSSEDLSRWDLARYNLHRADLHGAKLTGTILRSADLSAADLRGAALTGADLSGADLDCADLRNARIQRAACRRASFVGGNLSTGDLSESDLSGADLTKLTGLSGAVFRHAITDGGTSISVLPDAVDDATDFLGVGLGGVRIAPGLRSRLEYNQRKSFWLAWYADHPLTWWPVAWFWRLSDYGCRTRPIIIWLVGISIFFAMVYLVPYWTGASPVVENLDCYWCSELKRSVALKAVNVHVRAICFSLVTMTTLGFGNLNAHPESILGHVILTCQVLLSYVILAALVTRFAILFQSLGDGY